MADAQASGACGGNTMWVQVPSPVPKEKMRNLRKNVFFEGLERVANVSCGQNKRAKCLLIVLKKVLM